MRRGISPPGPGHTRFATLPIGTSFGPVISMMAANIIRAAAAGSSYILGAGCSAIWSMNAFMMGSSGMGLSRPYGSTHIWAGECRLGKQRLVHPLVVMARQDRATQER